MTGENGTPATPEWRLDPRPDMAASILRGVAEAAAGLARRRDDFLDDEPHIVRGTN